MNILLQSAVQSIDIHYLAQDETVLSQWDEKITLNSACHLCPEDLKRIMTIPMPCYTPTLDTSLRPTALCVTRKRRRDRARGGHDIILTARDVDIKAVKFVLRGFRDHQRRISSTTLHRGSTSAPACVTTTIPAPKLDQETLYDEEDFVPARPLQHRLATGNSIREIPDKVDGGITWTLRRFNLAGRKFVWDTEALYEYKAEWARKGDQFVQAGEQRFDTKLAWVETPFWAGILLGRQEKLHLAGGLDQTLVELVVASALTKSMLLEHGH